jgi:hypothetical protein
MVSSDPLTYIPRGEWAQIFKIAATYCPGSPALTALLGQSCLSSLVLPVQFYLSDYACETAVLGLNPAISPATVDCQSFDGLLSRMALPCRLSSEGRQNINNTTCSACFACSVFPLIVLYSKTVVLDITTTSNS